MIKNILFLFTIILFVGGCGEKKEEKTELKITEAQEPLKIEIAENKNAKEIKVALNNEKSEKNETYYFNYGIKSEYDPHAKPANEDASVREKPRTSIDANLQVRSPYENVKVSMLVKRLSKEFIVKCSACHNDYANGIIGPSLLDKDDKYIYESIIKFKNNEDANVLMSGLVNQMDEETIKRIATEIYEFNKQIKAMR
ncbi:c-type cytochrome [Campylobacterota bacterium DY0563]